MGIEPIRLLPGVYGNGTNYSAKGRWREASLVRWVDGYLRAIGGWARRRDSLEALIPSLIPAPDQSTSAMRALFAWYDNSGARYLAAGSTKALHIVSTTGVVTNITPAGFVPGPKNSGLMTGYGMGQYGRQAYGTARSGEGLLPSPVGNWRLDNWGQDLLAAGPLDGSTKLYKWTPGDLIATVVANSPTGFTDFVVTAERIVMVVGLDGDGRTVRWCDRENNTQWTSTVENYAGSRSLTGRGKLVAIRQVGDQYLIFGAADLHTARFVGAPYVYGITFVAGDCGPLGVNSIVVAEGKAYWPSQREFWVSDGISAMNMPCDVQDLFFDGRASNEGSKVFGFHLSAYNEIWWLYQSSGSATGDCDKYISYNYVTKAWMTGDMVRSAAIDSGIMRDVVMAAPTGALFNHELPNTLYGGQQPYAITGPIEIAEGNQIAHVGWIHPAEEHLGDVAYYIHARDRADGPRRTSGPYGARSPCPTTGVRGQQLEVEVRGLAAGFRLGTIRIDVTGGGVRP